jgi:hypothetical protein
METKTLVEVAAPVHSGLRLFLVSYVIISIPSSLKLPLWAFVIACVVYRP